MTIEGFWKEVKERYGEQDLARRRVSLPDYATGHFCKHRRFLTVGIDIFQWISEHLSHADTRKLPDEDASIKVVISGIASKIRYLISLPLNFVIVFDGKIKMDKLRWKREFEYNHDIIFETKYAMDLEIIKNDNHIMAGKFVSALIELLNAWNISYIHAPGDGEIELARLNQAGIIDAIITNDADAFAYGATIILRNFSKYAQDKPSTGNKKGTKTSKEFFVTPVDITLLNRIGLDTDKIMYIACCQGDDYSKGIRGMGIKKAFSLATNKKKMNDDFNPVQEFKNIYVGTNLDDYIRGKLPHSYKQRLKLLEKYKNDLADHIKLNARAYFNQAHNADIILPHDAIIASHFYPHFSKYLFKFESYETNLNELSGKLQVKCCLPKLPQPLSIKQFNKNEHIVYRGNDLKKSLGTTTFTKHGPIDTETISYTPYRWFDGLKYDTILTWTQIGKNSKRDMEFLADSLGTCYLWRAIVNANELELQESDFKVGKPENKEFVFEGEVYEQLCYPIKFKAREMFRRLLHLSAKATDENLNEIEEKPITKSLAVDILNIDENGTRLIESYIPQTPNSKAKGKRKTPTSQRTTLDSFSGSKKSPITIHSRTASSILNMSGASISYIGNKRTAYDFQSDDIENSPRKKHKITSKTESPAKLNPVLAEPFEDDAEVSKVLKTSDYVGNSYIEVDVDHEINKSEIFDKSNLLGDLMSVEEHTDAIDRDKIDSDNILDNFNSKNFEKFYQESTQKSANGFFDTISMETSNNHTDRNGILDRSSHEINDISDLSNLNESNNLSSIFAPRKEFQKDSRTVVRGESSLDRMTKLPTVPDEPNNTITSADDSFSSTGTIQKLFDMEEEKEKKKKKEILKNSKTINKEVYSLDDTFSTTGTIEKLLHKEGLEMGIKKVKKEGSILDQAVQNSRTDKEVIHTFVDLTMDSDDDKTDMKVDYSDIETIKSEQSTPVVNRIKDIVLKREKFTSKSTTIIDDYRIPPTGIPFPTIEIINGKQYEVYDSRIPAAVILGQPSGVYYGSTIPVGPAFNQQYQVKMEDIKPRNLSVKEEFENPDTEKSDANDSCRLPPEYKGEAYLAESTDDSEMWRDPKDVEHSDSDDELEIIEIF